MLDYTLTLMGHVLEFLNSSLQDCRLSLQDFSKIFSFLTDNAGNFLPTKHSFWGEETQKTQLTINMMCGSSFRQIN